ncbi:MAG: hypothetical protein LBJ75_01000 [Puniceicoccales bacterium]|jgi:transposase|nr:hypothetical protein [Puniceicoccales bacterium]
MDDERMISGIVYVLRNGLKGGMRRKNMDPKMLHNCFIRWSKGGMFARILQKLTEEGTNILMMDVPHLRVHRMAASLREGGASP